MIAPLRRRHLWLTRALLPASGLVLAAALAARPSWPVAAGPAGLRGEVSAGGSGLAVRQERSGTLLRLQPLDAPRAADPLVYLAAGAPDGSELPEGARFLGTLAGDAVVELPLEPDASGVLVFYGLGHHEVLGHAPLVGGER